MTLALWVYGVGMMLTGSLWVWGTLRAVRNPDPEKRKAGEESFQWRYFALVVTTWPITLTWMIREAIRVARRA